jgi:hypothetical protein
MNKQKTDWERKLMTLMVITIADALFAGRSRPITKDCSDVTVKHHKKISKFISQLLKTQREEIVSEIEGIKRLPNMAQNQNGNEYCSACGCPWDNIDNYCPDCATHNQALVDIIKILEKK